MGVEAWDVKTAFVRAIVHKRIFMRPPPGVAGYEGKCLILERALYGLQEAHKYFDELMKKTPFGFWVQAMRGGYGTICI